ncbi:GNAT family N-acetyltransferase [Fusobacterium pseudoperiodonticum]|uniref:GNAT family N-acetyltransferase n=1 Tax=Fusobacterium pseudoperiodonticum TaxID=2663009 RepID=UPI0028E3D181|nr:GNAT family N-acetyltransferase [Fusobacterium pseudoperiodonticum]
MFHKFEGKYDKIILEPLKKEDIEDLRLLRNKKENRECFIYQKEISKEEQEKWFDKYLEKETDIMFVASLKEDKRPIGYAALYDINDAKKTCEFGRIIVDKTKVLEKGMGFQITKCCCDIGFEKLGMNMIYLEVFSDNIPALKTYLKVGFIERKRYIKNDREIIYMEYFK